MQSQQPSRELDRQMLSSALEELYAVKPALDRLLLDEAAVPQDSKATEAARPFLCRAITGAEEQVD